MVMSLLESLYKSLYKNVKDPALSIFRSPWRPEKSCVFAATVLDPIAVSWRARPRYPLSCPYRTRPAAFCSDPGRQNFPQNLSGALKDFLIFRYWRGLSTYNNEHFELFSLAWLFPHFTRYFTSSWNLQLQFPRNSCCGIALVRAYARTSLLVCVSRSGRCSSLSRAG